MSKLSKADAQNGRCLFTLRSVTLDNKRKRKYQQYMPESGQRNKMQIGDTSHFN